MGEKDEVIVPDITFGATAMAAQKTAGAKLVIVDVNKNDLGFDLIKLKKINKRTKQLLIHISGRGADIKSIKKIIKNKRIKISRCGKLFFLNQIKNFLVLLEI